MEEAAKAHDVACVISGDVAQALSDGERQLLPLGHEQVKGISVEIPIFEYRVKGERGTEAADQTHVPSSRLAVSAGSEPS
jgi:class 3 adenylate cyclase